MGNTCCEDEKNGCCNDDDCCQKEECCCSDDKGCCKDDECCQVEKSMAHIMMGIADEVWEELMKDKMKKAFEKARGEKMDKAAGLAVEASISYWEGKMKEKAKWSEFEEKLKSVMSQN